MSTTVLYSDNVMDAWTITFGIGGRIKTNNGCVGIPKPALRAGILYIHRWYFKSLDNNLRVTEGKTQINETEKIWKY